MTAPFAALESRLNASILAHMPNAVATHATLGTANVVFKGDTETIDGIGMVTRRPEILVGITDWPTPAEGDDIVINGDDYQLRTPETFGVAFWRIGLSAS
mgnify:FL=1